MVLVKFHHSWPLLPWQRNLENMKTKVGYNSACIRDIVDVLASNGFSGSGNWIVSIKFYYDRHLLPSRRNLKTKTDKINKIVGGVWWRGCASRDLQWWCTVRSDQATVPGSRQCHCSDGCKESQIMVVADNTDVFVLLVHYYHTVNFKNHVITAN